MGNIKRRSKKILIILTILAMLMNIFPNVFLIYASNQDDFGTLILRKGYYDENDKIFALELCVKDMTFIATDLTFTYPSNSMQIIRYEDYLDNGEVKAASRVNQAIKDNSEITGATIDSMSEINQATGEIHTIVSVASTGGSSEPYDATGKEVVLATIYLHITDELLEVFDLKTEMFNLSTDKYFCVLNGDETESTDTNIFKVEGFDGTSLPTVSTLSVTKNPTEGKQYIHGDTIDLTGGQLTAIYTDGSQKVISMLDENVTIKTGEKEGAIADCNNKKITFEYENVIAELDVDVIDIVDKIVFFDRDNVLSGLEFLDGDEIPKEDLFIKTITKSGVEKEITLSDSKITLNSDFADVSKIDNPYFDAILVEYSGIQKIEITYQDDNVTQKTNFDIVVNDVVGQIKISDTNAPIKDYIVNDEFVKTGAIVVIGERTGATFGEVDMSSDNVLVTQIDGTKVDLTKHATDKELKVAYGGKETSYKINVKNTVKSIRVNMPEEVLELKHDKELEASDFAGITITEIMADGTDGNTIPLNFSWIDTTEYNSTTVEKQVLEIKYPYEDKYISDSISVKVKDELKSISIRNLKTEYVYKDKLDYTGAELYVEYVSGIIGPLLLEDDILTHTFNSSIIGEQDVVFTYDDDENSVNTTIRVNVKRGTLQAPSVSKLTIIEGQPLSEIASKLPVTEYGSVVWENPNETLKAGETKQVNAVYKMNDTYKDFYNDVALKVEVEAETKEVKSIAIETNPKLDYYEGQKFDATDLVLIATYTDGTTAKITTGYTIVGADEVLKTENNAITTKKITIKYKNLEPIELTITINPDIITGIKLNDENAKTTYKYNEELDLSNITVEKIMASGIEQNPVPITDSAVTISHNYDKTKLNDPQIINITYEGYTKQLIVKVEDYIAKIDISDETRGKLEQDYKYGDNILEKIAETINMNIYMASDITNPILKEITNNNIFADTTKLGEQIAKIKYQEQEISFKINVKDYVSGIEIVKEPTKKVYKINETLDLTGLIVRDVMASEETEAKKDTTLTEDKYTVSALDTSTEGLKEVTITRKDENVATVKFNVIVIKPDENMEIQINTLPTENTKYGKELNLVGGSIIVKPKGSTEGTIIPMTDESITVTGYDPYQKGQQEVTIKYIYEEVVDGEVVEKTLETSLPIVVVDYRTDNIKMTMLPGKLTYKFGEELDVTGGEVARLMASGTAFARSPLTMQMVSGYDPNKEGTQTITVKYFDAITTFTVTVVNNIYNISMNTNPTKTEYKYGEDLIVDGATIKVVKDSGTQIAPVTLDMVKGYDKNKEGQQTITISYKGYTTQFTVIVGKKPANPSDKPENKPGDNTNGNNGSNNNVINKVEYIVVFKDYDGTLLKREIVKQGEEATPPTVAKRKGYKFVGWDKDFSKIEMDMIITAQYEEIKLSSITLPNIPEITVGEELDLSNIKMDIFDEDGNKIKEIQITKDMISGFNPNKVGVQEVTVTYIDENGEVYKDTFKVNVKKATQTLGEKDKNEETSDLKEVVLPAIIGIIVTGLLLLLIATITKTNVEVYVTTKEGKKLIGKQKLGKSNKTINLDEYKNQMEGADTIELVINSKTVKALENEEIEVVINNETKQYPINETIVIK